MRGDATEFPLPLLRFSSGYRLAPTRLSMFISLVAAAKKHPATEQGPDENSPTGSHISRPKHLSERRVTYQAFTCTWNTYFFLG